MRSSIHNETERGIVRLSGIFALLLIPVAVVASCSAGQDSPFIGEEAFEQTGCGGSSTGGTFSIGGSLKGGTGGTTTCPSDTCTLFCPSRAGCQPVSSSVQRPGTQCEDLTQDRGHCGWVDANNDGSPEYTECCVDGCLDREYCLLHQDQTDDRCGSQGIECKTCGECSMCAGGGCVTANGASCSGGICQNGSCCTGCISGQDCFEDSPQNCGRNGGVCTNCDDNKFCTLDTCQNGVCQHTNQTGSCTDNNDCTVNDTCSGSNCTGQPRVCNDGNECTTDSCVQGTGCTAVPKTGSCNDGNICTTNDSCTNGTCTGTAINCNDGNQCTDDSCDPATGCKHVSKAQDTPCDDGAACTPGDRCNDDDNNPNTPRVCEPTGTLNCEDGNPCTSDAADCSTNTCPHGPINNGSPCSTGTLCSVGQTCQSGVCGGGTTINCDDGDPCTIDACSPTAGCTHMAGADGADCNDGNECTTGDSCDGGECVGEQIECVALDECHQVGACDDVTGTCSDPRKPNGAPCGNTGTCQSGRCEGDGIVPPTGGTGPGGGGPGGADNGGTTSGAGEGNGGASNGGNGAGTAGEGTSGSDGEGGTGNGGTSNAGNGDEPAPVFERDPGGCACRLPAPGPAQNGYAALALAVGLSLVTRRRRRAA